MIRKGREKVLSTNAGIFIISAEKPRDSTDKLLQLARKVRTFAKYRDTWVAQ